MPKMKTKSSAKKRLSLTKSGKVKRQKAYSSHILTKKDQKKKRNLRSATVLSNADKGEIIRLMPYVKK